jgi:hypothetical protein
LTQTLVEYHALASMQCILHQLIENGRRHFVVVGLLLSTQKHKINYVVSMGHSDQTRRQVCISKHHQKTGNSPEPTALRVSSACGRYSCAAGA